MNTQRWEHVLVAILATVHLMLAAGFSLAPPFEGAEELEHYRFARTLVLSRQLPDPYESWGGQYHQAPFYYLLVAPIRAMASDLDFEEMSERLNPFYGYAFTALGNDNKNLFLHRQAELFPPRGAGTARLVYVMRLVSVVLSMGSLAASYVAFLALWPDRPERRVMALAVVALHPHLAQVSATINNDNLLILLSTGALALLVQMERSGWSRRSAFWLGVVLGMALLAKVNAVFLVIPVGIAVLSDLRQRWRYAVFILALVAVIAGWWYVRNWAKYGDPTGSSVLFGVTQPGEAIHGGSLDPATGWPRMRFAYETFWARFGDGRVSVPDPFYDFFNGLVLVAAAGLVTGLGKTLLSTARANSSIHKRDVTLTGIVVIYAAAWVLLLAYYSSRAWSGVQGRYLLPGIAAWAALIAWGVDVWTPRRGRWIATLALVAALGAIAFVSLFAYYLPAYRVSSAPENAAERVHYTYEETAALVGFEPVTMRAHPGDRVSFTLTWVALNPTERDLQSYLHSVDANVARRDSFPATGNLLSTDWKPGDTWAEHYVVDIPADAEPGRVHTIVAGLYDPETGQPLAAVNADGKPVTPVVGRIAINRAVDRIDGEHYRFGNQFELAPPKMDYAESQLTLCLTWRAMRTTGVDYMLFVHVMDQNGAPISQRDGPAGGDYPTGVWARGEVVDQCVTLSVPDLPDGAQIALGLYDLADLARLLVTDEAGRPLSRPDMILLEP